MAQRCGDLRHNVLVAAIVLLTTGCSVATSVGPCKSLQVDATGDKVLAICWSDDAAALEAVNLAKVLGPASGSAQELFSQFAEERDRLQVRGIGELRTASGFRYQLSYPSIVQGRSQYVLEITLPEPVPVASLEGPIRAVADFVHSKHPDAAAVSLDVIPVGGGIIGDATFHFTAWKLARLTMEQYRAKQ